MSASGWRDRPRQRSTPPPRKTRQPWEAEEVALLKQLYEEHMPETAAQWISVAEQLGTIQRGAVPTPASRLGEWSEAEKQKLRELHAELENGTHVGSCQVRTAAGANSWRNS